MVPHNDGQQLIRDPLVFYISGIIFFAVYLLMLFTTDAKIPHLIEGAVELITGFLTLLAITGIGPSANR